MIFDLEQEHLLVDRLNELGSRRSFKRGDTLYTEGDSPQGLYFIESGLVGLIKLTASGSESLLRIFKEKQFFGHRTLFADETYHATARCLENCEVIFIDKKAVFKIFDEEPKAYYFLARALAKELRRAESRSVLVSEAQIQERVASALLLFKKLYPDHKWTRTEIANYCATRTPTVIKALGELESQGVIEQKRRDIEILDEEGLIDLVNT